VESASDRMRGLTAAAVLAFVGWQAGASVLHVGQELFLQPLEKHLRPLSATPEELIERCLEQDFALWRALREELAPDALVLVSFPAKVDVVALKVRLTRLVTLSYPRRFQGWPHDARKPGASAPWADGLRVTVLDLESGRDYSAWARCEELASGERFRLLRLESGTR
jgi:hypothetical protein